MLYQINPNTINYEEYVKTRSSKTIKDAKRGKKQLEKKGKVEIRVEYEIENIQKSSNFHIEKMKEKFQEKVLYEHPEEYIEIYINMIKQANKEKTKSNVEITNLLLNGIIIASTVTLKYKNRKMFILTAYDQKYKEYSPGKILLHHLVEESFQNNEIFCLGPNDYGYKKLWSTQHYNLNLLTYFFNESAKKIWTPYTNWKYIGNIIRVG